MYKRKKNLPINDKGKCRGLGWMGIRPFVCLSWLVGHLCLSILHATDFASQGSALVRGGVQGDAL